MEMEALRAKPIPEGEMPASSVHVVLKVLSQHNSNQFLKSVGLKTPTSSKSGSSHESEIQDQLAAEATAAVQGELDDQRKKIQDAEEERSRTQRELEDYKKITEHDTKEMVETNLLNKKLLSLHGNASSLT
jgi:molecular chaperone GrpE (heat shock protein)